MYVVSTTALCIYNKRMLIAQDSIRFCGRIAWQTFLINKFADIPDVVRVKKIKILFSRWWHFVTATSTIYQICFPVSAIIRPLRKSDALTMDILYLVNNHIRLHNHWPSMVSSFCVDSCLISAHWLHTICVPRCTAFFYQVLEYKSKNPI